MALRPRSSGVGAAELNSSHRQTSATDVAQHNRRPVKARLRQRKTAPYFSPQFFNFLKDLKKNNNREWFTRNKPRYESQLLEPSLRFVKDVAPILRTISPYLVADPKPFGGSLFRIYRDIRFSKDKSPYKTNVAMEFWHKKTGKKGYSGLYLHLAPGESFAGAGCWHPDAETLGRVRKAIVSKPEEWRKVKEGR